MYRICDYKTEIVPTKEKAELDSQRYRPMFLCVYFPFILFRLETQSWVSQGTLNSVGKCKLFNEASFFGEARDGGKKPGKEVTLGRLLSLSS